MLEAFVMMIESAVPDVIASVLLVDDDGTHLQHGAAPSLPDFYNEAIDGVEIGPCVGSCGTAAHRREQVIVDDITTDPLWVDFRDLAAEAGVRACWSTPVLSADGSLLGTFAMYYREPRRPDDVELALIDVFVRLATVAIERARADEVRDAALESERRAREELAFILDVTTRIASTLDYHQTMNELADAAVPALADVCMIDVLADGEILRAAAAGPMADELRRYPPLKDGGHPAARVLATGEATYQEQMTDDVLRSITRDEDHLQIVRRLGYESYVCLPLEARGTVFGTLTLVSAGSGRVYGPDDVTLARELAARAALVIDNARLYDSVLESERQLQAVVRAGAMLTSSLDLADVVDRLCTLLVPDIGDVCEVWVQAVDGTWHCQSAPGPLGELGEASAHVRTPPPVVAEVVSSAQPWNQVDVEPEIAAVMLDPRLAPDGLSSVTIVPLLGRGDVVGAITVGTVPGGSPDADPDLLPIIVGRVALAVDNARLYEAEVTVATALQQQLLPSRLPDVDGVEIAARYRPGGPGVDVGGDWYDVLLLPDGRVGFVIGDVMGRGVVAAGVMAELRNAVRGFALQGLDPAEAMTLLGRLIESNDRGSLATMLYAVLDPATGRVAVANAGHCPPLVIGANGDAWWLDVPPDPPLGAGLVTYSNVELPESAGATIVLYTDGLIERRGEALDDGLARLLTAALAAAGGGPEAMCDALIARLLDSQREPDDTALLVARLRRDS